LEHPVSVLYHPINKLLIALFGESSARFQELMVVVLVAAVLIPTSRRLSVASPGKLQQIMELLITGLEDLIEDVVGHGFGKRFLPFIMGLAVFIFVGNIFGLFYFVQPPTANPNTTFALSITAFLFYNIVGIVRLGPISYAKHFMGPVWWLFPLMVPLEIISHLARVLSLALRLFGNIFGEHTATGIFMGLVPFVIPWPMMGLGLLGATIQTFIFIMLTAVYISGAVGEEH
jgi:F-type H+-transporting ATPase subunit a